MSFFETVPETESDSPSSPITLFDATGALPDPIFRDSIFRLVDALTVGRPIAAS